MKKNKAKQVREALSLTPTEAGKLLCGYNGKGAYDQWMQLERAKKFSGITNSHFDLLLFLVGVRDLKTPGAAQALDKYIAALRDEREGT